jgi:hypothetical protein
VERVGEKLRAAADDSRGFVGMNWRYGMLSAQNYEFRAYIEE